MTRLAHTFASRAWTNEASLTYLDYDWNPVPLQFGFTWKLLKRCAAGRAWPRRGRTDSKLSKLRRSDPCRMERCVSSWNRFSDGRVERARARRFKSIQGESIL
jgi:hypothetical protein